MDEPILNTLVQAGVIEKYEIKMQDDSEVLTLYFMDNHKLIIEAHVGGEFESPPQLDF